MKKIYEISHADLAKIVADYVANKEKRGVIEVTVSIYLINEGKEKILGVRAEVEL